MTPRVRYGIFGIVGVIGLILLFTHPLIGIVLIAAAIAIPVVAYRCPEPRAAAPTAREPQAQADRRLARRTRPDLIQSSGFLVRSCGNRLKSRSEVHSSRMP